MYFNPPDFAGMQTPQRHVRWRWLGRAVLCIALMSLSELRVLAQAPPAPQQAKLATYQGAGCTGRDRLPVFEQWLGRKPDIVIDFLANESWQSMQSSTQWAAGCWRAWGNRVVFSLPMLPKDPRYTLAAGARGEYDEQIRRVAVTLAERGHGQAVIRPGWEFNAKWYPWSALEQPKDFVAYWRRFVTVMRSVPETSFRFDWCPVVGVDAVSPEAAYPGDDVVDIVGGDVYNNNWFPTGTTPAQRWHALRVAPYGLDWHRRFAALRGKPMSYPEWGTGTRPDGHGGGDDPVFMQGMLNWIRDNPVEYQGYWDYPAKDFNGQLSDGSKPASARVYLNEFRRAP